MTLTVIGLVLAVLILTYVLRDLEIRVDKLEQRIKQLEGADK